MRAKAPVAALGFTVKSGWTSAVLVAGPVGEPRLVDSRRVEISDPGVPESRQPYHEGFGTARGKTAVLARLVASVERFGAESVGAFIAAHEASYALRGAGLVVGSVIDPDTIANDHIRIHALEGRLFREVVRTAASARGVDCVVWRERDLYAAAAALFLQQEAALKGRVTAMGQQVEGPWRAEHKAAAMAALMILAR